MIIVVEIVRLQVTRVAVLAQVVHKDLAQEQSALVIQGMLIMV